jgi:hypothetical protein
MPASRLVSLIAIAFATILAAGCNGVDPSNAPSLSTTPPIRVAAVGANMGRRAAYQVFAEGDLPGTVTHVDVSEFNRLSVEELRASYDVLLFTWATSSKLDADFETRLLPFLEQGGGIIFEDAGNTVDLAPVAMAAPRFPYMGSFTLASVPGLTSGVSIDFPHNHFAFSAWSERLGPLIQVNGTSVGLYGGFPGGGRMVVTGTDQHLHGSKRSTRSSERNQYVFLRNEICWVAGCVNQPPVANAGGNRNVECTGAVTEVSLDASGSLDTDRDVLSFLWTGPFGIIRTEEPWGGTIALGLGEYHVDLAVSDSHGATTTDHAVLRIQDTVAPSVRLSLLSDTLWSPDHKMALAARISALDACDPSPFIDISVTSDEPSNGAGDGNTAPDWSLERLEDGTYNLWLRAERSGVGEGRTYAVTVTARDTSSNTAQAAAYVHVEHSP